MPEAAVLATIVTEFVGDGSKLVRSMDEMEKKAVRAGAAMAKSVGKDAAAATEKAAKAIAQTANVIGEIEVRSRAAQRAVEKFNRQIDEGGAVGSKSVRSLIQQQELYRMSIERTFGSLKKATPEVLADYRRIERQVDQAKGAVRELGDAFDDQSGELKEGGAQWRGLNDAVGTAAGKHGALVAKIGLVTMAWREGWQMGREIGRVLGVSDEGWNSFVSSVQRTAKPTMDRIGDISAVVLGLVASMSTLNDEYAENAIRGAALKGGDFFSNPGSNAPRLKAARRAEYGDTSPEGVAAGEQAFLRKVQGSRAIAEAKLEYAELTKNAAAVRALRIEIAQLTRNEAVLQGTDAGVADSIRTLTLRNLDLTDVLKARQAAQEKADELAKRLPADFFTIKPILEQVDPAIHARTLETLKAVSAAAAALPPDFFKIKPILIGPDSDINARTLANKRAEFESMESMLERLSAAYRENATTLEQVMGRAIGNVETMFGDVLYEGITGNLEGMKDAFKSFAKSVLRELTNLMAQKAVMWLLSRFAGGGGAALSGFSTVAYANGGVVPGGFRAFASGGVVDRPTLGLVGEGKYNEAVVPLPDGKSIPVEMSGGNGGKARHDSLTVSVAYEQGLVAQIVDMSSSASKDAIAMDIMTGGPIRKIIQQMVR